MLNTNIQEATYRTATSKTKHHTRQYHKTNANTKPKINVQLMRKIMTEKNLHYRLSWTKTVKCQYIDLEYKKMITKCLVMQHHRLNVLI